MVAEARNRTEYKKISEQFIHSTIQKQCVGKAACVWGQRAPTSTPEDTAAFLKQLLKPNIQGTWERASCFILQPPHQLGHISHTFHHAPGQMNPLSVATKGRGPKSQPHWTESLAILPLQPNSMKAMWKSTGVGHLWNTGREADAELTNAKPGVTVKGYFPKLGSVHLDL